jgi:hypothetical protein
VIITKVHLRNVLSDTVQADGRSPNLVGPLGAAPLDWTVSPEFELGYRLPSGFGAFSVSYRGLATQGVSRADEDASLAVTKSRVDLNQLDFDYSSDQWSLWPNCDMKWRLGARVAWIYFDTMALDPSLAVAGGPLSQRTSDSYVGAGPHASVELAHRFSDSGLSLVGRLDLTSLLGHVVQDFAESFPGPGPGTGNVRLSSSQAVPMVNGQIGVRWTPPQWRGVSFFLGYELERWWNVGRLSELVSSSQGDVTDQGIVLQASINY